MNGGGSEREGDTESETDSRLWAVSTEPNAGLKLTDHGDHDLSQSQTLNQLSHPGAPRVISLKQTRSCLSSGQNPVMDSYLILSKSQSHYGGLKVLYHPHSLATFWVILCNPLLIHSAPAHLLHYFTCTAPRMFLPQHLDACYFFHLEVLAHTCRLAHTFSPQVLILIFQTFYDHLI